MSHPIRVAALVKKYKRSHEMDSIVIGALFHDTLEDTNHTEQEIADLYGEICAGIVAEVTSDENEILRIGKTLTDDPKLWKRLGKREYLARKLPMMSSWALVVKLCDRQDNVSDFCVAPDSFIQKYADETRFILARLKAERKLSDTHERIIKDIEALMAIYAA